MAKNLTVYRICDRMAVIITIFYNMLSGACQGAWLPNLVPALAGLVVFPGEGDLSLDSVEPYIGKHALSYVC